MTVSELGDAAIGRSAPGHLKPSRSKPDKAWSWFEKYNSILQSWSFQSKQHCSVTARDSWFHRPLLVVCVLEGPEINGDDDNPAAAKRRRLRQELTGETHPSAADAATNEIDHYLSVMVPAEFEDDPLRFWEKHQSSFPILSVVARVSSNEHNFCPGGVYVQYNRLCAHVYHMLITHCPS